jgi:hypothetical protein
MIELIDFQATDTYADQSIAGHAPDVCAAGSVWQLLSGTIKLSNTWGDWGGPGAYIQNPGVGGAAHINLGV